MPDPAPLCSERMTVELRHLRSFLAIVDHGTITAAAHHLHLSQPALSRTLGQLEHRLGRLLIDRSTHHLALTDAGRTFEEAARTAVRAFEAAVASVGDAVPPLRFGHSWSGATHAAAIVRRWNAAHPDQPVQPRRRDDRFAGLTSGQVDVALVRGPVTTPSLRASAIDHETRVAALPRGHHLTTRTTISLADLADEVLVVSTVAGTTTLDLWPPEARPTVGLDTATVDDWILAIATGAGVGITASSTAELHPHPDVRFVAITDAPTMPVSLVWPRGRPHPQTTAFVASARRAMGDLRAARTPP